MPSNSLPAVPPDRSDRRGSEPDVAANPTASSPLKFFHRGATVHSSLAYMGSIVSFLANGDETAGGLAAMLVHSRLGSEPPPHVHHREHELFYVLDGEIEFFCEGEERSSLVAAGDVAFLPQGRAHAMYFRTPEVRALAVAHASAGGPVGIDAYLRQMAVGPASSMELPANATQYRTASPAELEHAVRLAEDSFGTLLSPEETIRRLPFYPGFGANLGVSGPA